METEPAQSGCKPPPGLEIAPFQTNPATAVKNITAFSFCERNGKRPQKQGLTFKNPLTCKLSLAW